MGITRQSQVRENQEQRAKTFNVRFIAGTTLATRRAMWVFGIQANAQSHTQEDRNSDTCGYCATAAQPALTWSTSAAPRPIGPINIFYR
jgi:hypothetical protein